MKRERYVKALEKMYKEYYTGEGGYCRYFSECRKNTEKPCVIASDKARVGKKYGNGKVPKIVFIGLEGLTNKELEGIDVYKQIIEPSNSADNPHYMGVRYVLAYLLSEFLNKSKPCDAQLNTLNRDEYIQTIEYFTLLNCFKCAFHPNKKSSKMSRTKAMKKNCQEILLREIEILEPDILVIQVKTDRPWDLEENINIKFGEGTAGEHLDGDSTTGAYKYKPFILIWTYHGAGGPKTRGWVKDPDYIKKVNHTLDIAIEEFKKSNNKFD